MTRLRTIIGLTAAAITLSCSPAFGLQTDAWFAAKIWTGTGQPIDNGVLVTVDGKIESVGPRDSVQIPPTATIHELGSHQMMPGIVIGQTNLAGIRDDERTLTPQNQALDEFDFFDDYVDYLKGGVTSVQISPGNNRLMPGVGAVVKLAGEDLVGRTLMERESLRVVLDSSSRNPPRIYEPPVGPVSEDRPLTATKPQISTTLVGSLAGLRVIFAAATSTDAGKVESDEIVSAVHQYLKASKVVRFNAKTAPEIRGAISLAKEFQLQAILVGCVNLEPFENEFGEWAKFVNGVVLTAQPRANFSNVDIDAVETTIHPWENARELIQAGIPVAIRPSRDRELTEMLFVAGQFMQDGLSESEIVAMLSSLPAKMMGISDRVGTLEAGKDADFVVLSGPPLKLRTTVTATYVDGENVFDRDVPSTATLVRAGRVYTGDGHFIQDGSVVVKGKTVRGVGNDVSAPIDADVKNFPNGVIVPGFVDLGSGLGIGGALTGNITLQTKLGGQLYPDDPAIKYVRKHGITTALLGSSTGSNGTPLVAFKLGDDVRVIGDPVAIRYRVADDSPASSIKTLDRVLKLGKAYHDSFIKYEKDLAEYKKKKAASEAKQKAEQAKKKAEALKKKSTDKKGDSEKNKTDKKDEGKKEDEKKSDTPKKESNGDKETEGKKDAGSDKDDKQQEKAGEKKADAKKGSKESTETADDKKKDTEPKKPKIKEALEPYRALFRGEIPAFVEARRLPAIKEALKLFVDKYKVRTVIVGADDLVREPDLLNGRDVGICAGPALSITVDDAEINLPQLFANERIPFGFQTRATTGVAALPAVVSYSVSRGLGVDDGLSALTASPAKLLSKKMKFGQLHVGRDADLVVLSGPPFEHATKVLAVMIDGAWVYEYEEEE